jgi:hypothetical protein
LPQRQLFGAEDESYVQDAELLSRSRWKTSISDRSNQRKGMQATEEGGKSLFKRWFPLP